MKLAAASGHKRFPPLCNAIPSHFLCDYYIGHHPNRFILFSFVEILRLRPSEEINDKFRERERIESLRLARRNFRSDAPKLLPSVRLLLQQQKTFLMKTHQRRWRTSFWRFWSWRVGWCLVNWLVCSLDLRPASPSLHFRQCDGYLCLPFANEPVKTNCISNSPEWERQRSQEKPVVRMK